MTTPHIYDENEERVELPWKYEICCQCRGHGTSSAYLGTFTSEEWAEQDDEFKEDYIAGRYDKICETCEGTGKEKIIDKEKCSKEQLDSYYERIQQEAEDEHYRRLESGYYRGL